MLSILFVATLVVSGPPAHGQGDPTITLGCCPNDIAVNPTTNMIYVTNSTPPAIPPANIWVISGATNTVVTTVAVGHCPIGVAVDQKTNMIYVANNCDNDVSVVSGASNTVVATIGLGPSSSSFGQRPAGVAVNPKTDRVYTANSADNTVSVIDGATNTLMATIPPSGGCTGGGICAPSWIAVDASTNRIYVSNTGGGGSVTVIDGATNMVVASVAVSGPAHLGVLQAKGKTPALIYVATQGGSNNAVTVISGTTNMVVATVTVGTGPSGIGINPKNETIYVSNSISNSVSVISEKAGNTVVSTIPIVCGGANCAPVSVQVDHRTALVYVANFGTPGNTPEGGSVSVV